MSVLPVCKRWRRGPHGIRFSFMLSGVDRKLALCRGQAMKVAASTGGDVLSWTVLVGFAMSVLRGRTRVEDQRSADSWARRYPRHSPLECPRTQSTVHPTSRRRRTTARKSPSSRWTVNRGYHQVAQGEGIETNLTQYNHYSAVHERLPHDERYTVLLPPVQNIG